MVAWIAPATCSRTFKTVYALGKTFRRLHRGGIYGNFVCLENGQEYRICSLPRLWRLSLWLGKGELLDLTDEDI